MTTVVTVEGGIVEVTVAVTVVFTEVVSVLETVTVVGAVSV
jgi:hypothetical protein